MKHSKIIVLLGALLLPASVAQACIPRPDLEGLYGFQLNVGGKDFLDLVNIDQACQIGWVSGSLAGNLTVPERFTTKIVGGSFVEAVGPLDQDSSVTMELNIESLENGKPLKARYVLTDTRSARSHQRNCMGKVYFEGETGAVPFSCFRFTVAKAYRP